MWLYLEFRRKPQKHIKLLSTPNLDKLRSRAGQAAETIFFAVILHQMHASEMWNVKNSTVKFYSQIGQAKCEYIKMTLFFPSFIDQLGSKGNGRSILWKFSTALRETQMCYPHKYIAFSPYSFKSSTWSFECLRNTRSP